MSKVISGTEDFTGGPLERPDGSDNGNKFSELVSRFMERIANHDHSGESSQIISLPPNVTDKFITPTFSADGVGRYKTELLLTLGTFLNKNPMFYYKRQADPDVNASWKRFYPSYDIDPTENKRVTLRKLMLNSIDIRIVS